MDIFLQQFINGLTLGCVYAVVALGYTMVYGIIQLINFARTSPAASCCCTGCCAGDGTSPGCRRSCGRTSEATRSAKEVTR